VLNPKKKFLENISYFYIFSLTILFVLAHTGFIQLRIVLLIILLSILFLRNDLKNFKQRIFLTIILTLDILFVFINFLRGNLTQGNFLTETYFNFFLLILFFKIINFNFINLLKYSVYFFFTIECLAIISKYTTGYFLFHFNISEKFYNYNLWPYFKLNGILSSAILNSTLVISTFLFSYYFKNKFYLILALIVAFIIPTYRAFSFIIVFLIAYSIVEYYFFKKKKIIILVFSYSLIIFLFYSYHYLKNPKFKIAVQSSIGVRLEHAKNLFKEKSYSIQIKESENKSIIVLPQNLKNSQELLVSPEKYKYSEYERIIATLYKKDKNSYERITSKENYFNKDFLINSLNEIAKKNLLDDNELKVLTEYMTTIANWTPIRSSEEVINERVYIMKSKIHYENFFINNYQNNNLIRALLHLFLIIYLFYKSTVFLYKNKSSENILFFSMTVSICISHLFDIWVTNYLSSIYIFIFYFYIYFKVSSKKFIN
jgi:hypothetical protein